MDPSPKQKAREDSSIEPYAPTDLGREQGHLGVLAFLCQGEAQRSVLTLKNTFNRSPGNITNIMHGPKTYNLVRLNAMFFQLIRSNHHYQDQFNYSLNPKH